MDKKELKNLTLEDLQRSGLTEQDFKKMGIIPCDDNEAYRVLDSTFSTYGYIIPYFDINGKISDFIRFRFLDELIGKNKKLVRYSQPKGTGTRLYFSPCIKWSKILKDPSITITFTEGEKKAYSACKAGIPTIGLGGVNSFSDKFTKKLIEDFKAIEFNGRKVLICYDNDLQSNEDVNKASKQLAKLLDIEGAQVFNKILPFNPYHKIGLDDYLLTNTVDDFNELQEDSFSNLNQLHDMNDEVAYIETIGKFYIIKSNLFVTSSQLKNDVYPHIIFEGSTPPESVAKPWVAWENRRTHKRLTYKPAQPNITDDNELNLWKGWGAIPEKGSVKPFLDAVNKLFDNDKDLITWFLDWVAYPIQYPATKMLTGVLLQSVEQGTGKSSIGLCIGAMYGDNYYLVDDTQLHHSNFNEWAVNKQFILGDEVSGKDKRSESDRLKNLITRPTITINCKYMPSYDVPDCINYLFTSNHPDALNIEPDDRRFFIHRIKNGNGLTLKQGQALEKFRNGKGKNYLLHYFIHEHVISQGFDHRARPPMTRAKEELIEHSLTEIERFLTEIKNNPEHSLKTVGNQPINCDLFTTSEILKLFQAHNPKAPATSAAIGRSINKIFSNSEKYYTNTSKGWQYIRPLRNIEKWTKASQAERQEHYDKWHTQLEPKKKATKFKVIDNGK